MSYLIQYSINNVTCSIRNSINESMNERTFLMSRNATFDSVINLVDYEVKENVDEFIFYPLRDFIFIAACMVGVKIRNRIK